MRPGYAWPISSEAVQSLLHSVCWRGLGEVNEKVTGFGIFGWRTEYRKKNLFAEPFGCSGGGSLCRRTRSEEEGNNEGV